MPDGRVISFPDEMPLPEINKALEGLTINPSPTQELRTAPAQTAGIERYARGALDAAVRGVDVGLGLPGDLIHWVNPKGGLDNSLWFRHGLPTSNELLGMTGRWGLTQRADTIPEKGWERIASEGLAGLTSAAPFLAAGMPPVSTLATGAVAGAAGEAAHELMPGTERAVGAAVGLAGAATAARSIGRMAKQLGTSETLQDAGTELQRAVRDWRANVMPAAEAKAWAPVDAAIPGNTPVMLMNLNAALNDINRSAPTQQGLADLLTATFPRQMQDRLAGRLGTTWEDARTIRTMIGNAMSTPKLVEEIDPRNMRRLYGAISQDLNDTATAVGAQDLFNTANAESTRLHLLAQNPMSRIARGTVEHGNDPNPEAIANTLLNEGKRGGTSLSALREEVPDAVNELGAALLRTNPRLWKNLAPEAKEALAVDPSLRRGIDLALPPSKGTATHALQSLAGGTFSHSLAMLLGHIAAPGLNPLLTGAAGELGGMVAPSVWRGGRQMLADPTRMMGLPAVGAIAGGNALIPDVPPSQ